jgi:hypothetical protein
MDLALELEVRFPRGVAYYRGRAEAAPAKFRQEVNRVTKPIRQHPAVFSRGILEGTFGLGPVGRIQLFQCKLPVLRVPTDTSAHQRSPTDSQTLLKKFSRGDRNAFVGPVIPSLGTLRLHELEAH